MKQIKAHTLPIRLSYYAEDKKAYAQILKDARKEQERARFPISGSITARKQKR